MKSLRLDQLLCLLPILLVCSPITLSAAELFVADRANERVLSFDEESGNFLRVVTDQGLSQPSGLTFGPGGFLYVSNSAGFPGGAASVVKVDPLTGTTTPFITDVIGAGGVAYHESSNTLFVSEFGNFDGDEVFRYDATGALLQTLGSGSAPTARSGMTFDANGNLYVSEFNLTGVGSVLRYAAPVGNPTEPFSTTGSTFASGADVTLAIPAPAAGFNGLAFDDNGQLFVASLIGQSLIKFQVSGGTVVDGNPFGAPLPYPSGVLIGEDGNILVSGLGNDNPSDPFYGPATFPGSITRFNAAMFGNAPFLMGDVNRDSTVDGADLGAWQATYGTPYSQMANADLDGDFDTDGRDFLLWQRAVGNAGAAGPFQPTAMARYVLVVDVVGIPEPSAVVLLTVAMVGSLVRRS
jgi:hypothetical protein